MQFTPCSSPTTHVPHWLAAQLTPRRILAVDWVQDDGGPSIGLVSRIRNVCNRQLSISPHRISPQCRNCFRNRRNRKEAKGKTSKDRMEFYLPLSFAAKIAVLDPVMGDDGELYVAAEVVPIYKSIIPFADIILPNQFEAEVLSGHKLDSVESIHVVLWALHQQYRIRHVVISSLRLDSHPRVIFCCGSTATEHFGSQPFMIEAPIIDGPFVGTGDLFAALLLAQLHPSIDQLTPTANVPATELPLAKALELVIASMHGILKNTKAAMDRQLQEDGDMTSLTEQEKLVRVSRAAELRLVNSQKELVDPVVIFKATPI
jgi:pyridoxine kinase